MSDDIWKAACEDRRDAELSRLRTENEALRRQVHEWQQETSDLNLKLASASFDAADLRKRVGELQEDILVEEIETLRRRVAELDVLVREQNDKWADDVLRVETAEKRVEALQAELRHMYTFDNQHREKIAELIAQLRREKI